MSGNKLKWLDWKKEDFIIQEMKTQEWKSYEEKYPNLSWGTCILEKKDNGKIIVVQRFKDKETCRRYCTAPVTFDFSGGL